MATRTTAVGPEGPGISGVGKVDAGLASRSVLGMRVDGTSYEDAARRVVRWTHEKRQAYVCIGTVHMVMEAFDSRAFQRTVNGADLVTPDGMPLVWVLKTLGVKDASRVYGPNLMLRIAAQAAREDVPIGLYGGTPESLETLQKVLEEWFPGIKVACKIAPPFRPLTPEEDEAVTKEIIESGARILFVGIGCPKQERLMATHKDRVPAVMLGMGAAFDFHTVGCVRRRIGCSHRAWSGHSGC